MSTPENSKPKKRIKKLLIGAFVFFFVIPMFFVVVASVFGGGDSNTSESDSNSVASTPEKPDPDYSTLRACNKWFEVVDEGRKGVQTTEELREGFKKVYEAAEFSEVPQVLDAATRLLASITIYNLERFEKANTDMGNACKAAGW